jgi:hypothetical protein
MYNYFGSRVKSLGGENEKIVSSEETKEAHAAGFG